MLRTFLDIYGNIQYVPFTSGYINYNNITDLYYSNIIQDPYSNSSLIIKKNPDIIYTTESESPSNIITVIPRQTYYKTNPTLDVNNDPDLRKRISSYMYNKFKNIWLPFSFIKLQKYLKNENGKIIFIKNMSEYDNNKTENDDLKIEFILDNVFGKHEVVKFLDKFVRNHNVNWYDLKTKHIDKIKNDLYEKIKNHIKKIVLDTL